MLLVEDTGQGHGKGNVYGFGRMKVGWKDLLLKVRKMVEVKEKTFNVGSRKIKHGHKIK